MWFKVDEPCEFNEDKTEVMWLALWNRAHVDEFLIIQQIKQLPNFDGIFVTVFEKAISQDLVQR
jgi:hypothetical protein